MSILQYDVPGAAIVQMAELRDKIDAYRASCVIRYREPRRHNVDLNRWWNGVSAKRKRQLEKKIAAEKIAAAEWLKRNESKLPDMESGRDSHAELYREFYHPNTSKNPDDKDGVDFSLPLQEPRHDNSDSSVTEVKLAETCRPKDIASEYFATSELASGPLSSSWAKVEDALSCGLYGKPMTWDEDERLRRATAFTKPTSRRRKELSKRERVPTPKYLIHASTGNVWDPLIGEFRAYPFYEFNPHIPALQLMSHKSRHKSDVDLSKHTVVDAEMLPGEARHRFRYPKPDLRDLEQRLGDAYHMQGVDKNDPAFQAWLDSGDYDALVIALCGYGWPHHPKVADWMPQMSRPVVLRGTCFAPTKQYFRDRRRGPLSLPSFGPLDSRKKPSR